MGTMMKHMSIGSKFTLTICVTAVVMMLVGLVVIYQQEEDKMDLMLTNRAKVLSQQILIGRAYLAQNYVGKIKKSKAGADIQVSKDHTNSPDAIPVPATAVREMGEEANKTGLYNARLVSQNPINPVNQPKDMFENEAMRAIMSGAESYARRDDVNGVQTFRRAVVDKAVSGACIGCHTGSQIGDVLGMHATAVKPPATADAVPVAIVSLCSWPGSRRCT